MAEMERKAALGAARAAKRPIGRTGVPALGCIRLDVEPDGVTWTGSDLANTVRARIDRTDSTGGSWSALVPAGPLVDVLRTATGSTVDVEPADEHEPAGTVAAVRIGGAVLRCQPLDDWPAVVVPAPAAWIDGPSYLGALRAVLPAASADTARPVLSAVLHEADGTLVATDSYRLHVATGPALYGAGIVDRSTARMVSALAGKRYAGTIGIRLDGEGPYGERTATFALDGVTVVGRLVDGEYPSWRMLVPEPAEAGTARSCSWTVAGKPCGAPFGDAVDGSGRLCGSGHHEPGTVTLADPAAFLGAVVSAGVVAGDGPIRLDLNGSVALVADRPDLGSTTATVAGATYDGPALVVGVNAGFLGDAAAAVGAVRIDARDGLKPLRLDGPAGTALVMPVRLGA